MELSSDRDFGGSLLDLPPGGAAAIVALGREAVDLVANVVVIQAAATLYVHPDSVVIRLKPTGDMRDRANLNGLIPVGRKERDGEGVSVRAGGLEAVRFPRVEMRTVADAVKPGISPKGASDSGTVRALIVGEHPLERRGLEAILREEVGLTDICQADSAEMGLALAREKRPELAIVDIHLDASIPARELCAQLRAVITQARIVLLSASARVSEIRDCLMAGANGCLLKDTPDRDLAESIRVLLTGKTVIDPSVAQKLACELTRNAPEVSVWLSSREREVLDLLADGCANRQIADRLVLSETTVKGYVRRLFEKVSASSRLEVVVHARRIGLL
jgi:DNA-binding NarL/FixJ family response regulator